MFYWWYISAMKFSELLTIVQDEPVFDTALLLAGNVDRPAIQRQLAKWRQTGHIFQLRRGLYSLAPPYRHVAPHPFLVANRLVGASYVSCESALAWYSLIPEYTPVTVSVTTQRPDGWESPVGSFTFRHVKVDYLYGYERVEVAVRQHAFVAHPEKALLDLIYLTPGGEAPASLEELRLQNLTKLNPERLRQFAERSGRPKLQRAVGHVLALAEAQHEAYISL